MSSLNDWLKTQSPEIREAYNREQVKTKSTTSSQPSGTYHADGSFTPKKESPSSSGGSSGGDFTPSPYTSYQAPSRPQLSYGEAQGRAQGQIDPIYQRALENVRASIHPGQNNAAQVAANRGLGQSGLAADALNKVTINANNRTADLEAERSSKIAALAQALMDQDFSRQQSVEQQAMQRWMAENNLIGQQNAFNYGIYSDRLNRQDQSERFAFEKKLQEALMTGRFYLD